MRTPEDHIIFPLDVPTFKEALQYVQLLKARVGTFKVGLELFIREGPPILKAMRDAGARGIFLDLKLHDIPVTVKRALKTAQLHRPRFITVHCDEGSGIFSEVINGQEPGFNILAVTLLTSINQEKLEALGLRDEYVKDLRALVLMRSRMAKDAGCHGVVCSGHEVRAVKREFGDSLITVIPGIRPAWSLVDGDDQQRIVTPGNAVQRGADYIVVGRPIRDAMDPLLAARMVAEEIASVL
jgi:orotidine-5'-phosphate decarboxylase